MFESANRIEEPLGFVIELEEESPMSNLLPEIRHSLRVLRKEPGFALVVGFTLALGLGVNATVFGMLDAMLLRPFPFPDAERLVVLQESPRGGSHPELVAPANFLDWRDQSESYERVVAWEWWDATLTTDEEPDRVQGFRVTPGFFELLGVEAAIGRTFAPEEEDVGKHRRIVLGDGLWKRRFGADSAIVGREILVDGEPYTVVGVAPERFAFPVGAQAWSPLALTAQRKADREDRTLVAAGKLVEGQTVDGAQEEMNVITRRLEREFPDTNRDRSAKVSVLSDALREGFTGPMVATLQGVAAIVLLGACANIAGLILARQIERRRELTLRTVLGASGARIVRQLAIENVVLALAASLLAILFAWAALEVLRTSMPAEMARFVEGWDNLGLNRRVAGLTPLLALGIGLVVGLPSAIAASRSDGSLSDAVKDGGRGTGAGVRQKRGRQSLVTAEIALALSLLVAAGLAVKGSRRLATEPGGFDTEDLLTLEIPLPESKYQGPAARRAFADDLLAGVADLPSVGRVSLSNILPAAGWSPATAFQIEGEPPPEPHLRPTTGLRIVSPGFFETLSIPMLRGRALSSIDSEDANPVAVVSASMAARFWPNADPIGKRLRLEDPEGAWMTVVGVAGNIRMFNWWDGEDAAALYLPWRQSPSRGTVHLALRTKGEAGDVAFAVREVLRSIDPALLVDRVRTMPQAVAENNFGLKYVGSIMGICGAIALLLSISGIYGLMAYATSQRSHEFGVRIALGATATDVMRSTMKLAAALTGAGVLIGLALALAIGEVLQSSLLGIVAFDPTVFAIAALGLAAAALVAALVPARRVLRFDPASILRSQ
jgi:predicted permease